MTRDGLIDGFRAAAAADHRVRALFLTGSLGRGEGDAFSDVDLLLVVAGADIAGFIGGLRDWAAEVVEPVLWRQLFPGAPIFTAVGPGWLRYDLNIAAPEAVRQPQAALRAPVDKDVLLPNLPASWPPPKPPIAELERLVEEFLRILGLLPVGIGRKEYVLVASGAGLLRQHLISLLVMEQRLPAPQGALHLSAILPPSDMALLERLPPIVGERAAAIAASVTIANLFLPRARRFVHDCGAAWPHRLEEEMRRHLREALGIELDP